MARNSRRSAKTRSNILNTKNINTLAGNVNDTMKSLYSDSYLSDRNNIDGLNAVGDSIEDNINAIIRRNSQYDVSTTSKLYSRVMRKNSIGDSKAEGELSNELESLFGNQTFTDAVLGSYLSNKWIRDLDKEIDTVLKYCPKMKDALDILKDAVLSSDSTSKDFVYPKVAISDDSELKIVTDRIDKISKKYKLQDKVEEWYETASTYGESLVYRVPYAKAIEKLLKQPSLNNRIGMSIMENGVVNNAFVQLEKSELAETTKELNGASLRIEIDTTRMLSSSIDDIKTVNRINKNQPANLMETFINDLDSGEKVLGEKAKLNKVLPDDLVIPDGLNARDNYNSTGKQNSNNKMSLKSKGCVIKTLDRANLIRLYIDDMLIGYYYLEFKNNKELDQFYQMDSSKSAGSAKGISTMQKTITDNIENGRTDHLMKQVAKQISSKLDDTFVNANQDLTKEIYTILKYNDAFSSDSAVKISFLPPEDVKRLVFKEDKDLHIGISDIQNGLLSGKLLAMLYITYVTGTLTRGQDKRVYYVKQTVETNIAQTLLNVINQIKKSNFNMRSIENLNNLLNMTGRFNDYIIPVGPSGDSPIQFEVMPGQQFEINNDLFNMLEENAVNSTGVPMEIVQARLSPDFATQYTSSSLKLLRKVYRRQCKVEDFISEIYTDIYTTEYDEYQQIDCELPPPVFLSMTNTSQLLNNTKEYCQSIADMEYEGEQGDNVEHEKALFLKKFIKSTLSTYIRPSEIDRHRAAAKFEVAILNREKPEDAEA